MTKNQIQNIQVGDTVEVGGKIQCYRGRVTFVESYTGTVTDVEVRWKDGKKTNIDAKHLKNFKLIPQSTNREQKGN